MTTESKPDAAGAASAPEDHAARIAAAQQAHLAAITALGVAKTAEAKAFHAFLAHRDPGIPHDKTACRAISEGYSAANKASVLAKKKMHEAEAKLTFLTFGLNDLEDGPFSDLMMRGTRVMVVGPGDLPFGSPFGDSSPSGFSLEDLLGGLFRRGPFGRG